MAKRKRLTPPNPDYLGPDYLGAPEPAPPGIGGGAASGPVAPIAQIAGAASSGAALEEMADTLARARKEGRMVLSLPLDEIRLEYLIRDRMVTDQAEMEALKGSMAARGQQTPIEVAALTGGGYGLISGWRRCQALAQLLAETGEARFGTVLALLRHPEYAPDAYLAMVEENEIRVGLSYFERARIAARAVEQGVFETEKRALQQLFPTASRSKRSKIRSFLPIVHALEDTLRFPQGLSERAGLALSRVLQGDADGQIAARLRAALTAATPDDAQAEQACLQAALAGPVEQQAPEKPARTDRTAQDMGRNMAQDVAPGVRMKVHSGGGVTLSGVGMTDALRADLTVWLAKRGG